MPGPIGEAYVEIRPDLSGFDAEVRRGIDRALDAAGRQAEAAGEQMEDAFREAALQMELALEEVGGADVFAEIAAGAEATGERIDNSFREAARQSDAALNNIGGPDAFLPAVVSAEVAGERIDNSFKEAATQSNGALATIGAGAALAGIGLAAAAIGGLAYIGVNSAADLGESINAINVTLGDGAESFLAFSENAADSLGITQGALNQAVIPMGALLRNAGLEGDELGGTLAELSQRAADVGSVMNKDVNEVLEAFGAAVRGEAEPARALGISFDDAAVSAKAVALGLASSTSEVDDAAKAQARLAIIMEQTDQAAGDFANTADSLPNMMRRLKATGEEAAQSLGTALIPGLQTAGSAILDNLPSLEPYLESIGSALGAVVGQIAPLLGPLLQSVLSILTSITLAFGPIASAILGALSPIISGISNIFAQVAPVIGNLFSTLAPVIAGIGNAFGQILVTMAPVITSLVQGLGPVLEEIIGVVADLAPFFLQWVGILAERLGPIIELLVPIILRLAEAFSGALVEVLPVVITIAEALLDVIEILLPIFGQIVDVVLEVAGTIVSHLAGALTIILEALVPILPILGELIAALADALLPVLPALLPPILQIVEAFALLLAALLPLLVPLLQLVTIFIEQIGAPVLLAIAEAIAAITGGFTGFLLEVVAVIQGIIGWVLQFIGEVETIPTRVAAWLSGLPGILTTFISNAFQAAKDQAKRAIDEIVGFVTGLPGRITAIAATVLEAAKSIGRAIIDGIAAGISAATGFVADVVSGLGRAITNLINTQVIDRINNALPNSWELPGPVPDINLPDNPLPRLPTFDTGGIVGGPRGAPVLAILHGGETVLPTHRYPGMADRGGVTVNVNVAIPDADPATARRAGRIIGDAAAQRIAELDLGMHARLAAEV